MPSADRHLGDLELLERALGSDLPPDPHAESCPACRARITGLAEGRTRQETRSGCTSPAGKMGFAGARQQTRQVIAGMPRRQQDAARTSNLPIMVRTVPEVRRSSYHRLPAGAEGLPPNRIARMDDIRLVRRLPMASDLR